MTDEQSVAEEFEQLRARARERTSPEMQEMQQRALDQTERETAGKALDVGAIAPDFTLRRADDDREVRLYDALDAGPVVLSFYRGQWCPYCSLELRGLERHYSEIQDAGAQVFYVGPETRDKANEMLIKTESSIPVLYDLDGAVMEAYGVGFDLPDFLHPMYERFGFPDQNELTGWRLPVPATYIIDRDRVVRARHFDVDYKQRMDPVEIVARVKELAE